jgi:hypothetical protein
LRDIITKYDDIREVELTGIEIKTRLEEKIVPKIESCIKSEIHFTIGFSARHNVANRTSQYYPLRDGWNKGYFELDVVYNPLNIKALESAAIEHNRNSPFLCNDNDGGGGLINLEHGCWVLYLKTAHRKPIPTTIRPKAKIGRKTKRRRREIAKPIDFCKPSIYHLPYLFIQIISLSFKSTA